MKLAAGLLFASALFGQFSESERKGLTEDRQALRGRVTVVTFVSARCPYSDSYGLRLETLYKEYTPKGVRFLFVNSNSNESQAETAEFARKHAFSFPIFHDGASRAAAQFEAEFTPETFVLDPEAGVRYRGAVDDSVNPARVKTEGLRMALNAVLAGTPVAVPRTKAFGCTIKRPRRTAAQPMLPLGTEQYAAMVNSHHGEILVVDFWATWCEPCREEMPQLGKLQQASGNFRLVTVSCDEPEQSAAAVAALKAAGLSGPSYRKDTDDDGHFIHSVSPAWSGALPALFLYDRNGRLTRSFIGETDMREVQTAIGQLR